MKFLLLTTLFCISLGRWTVAQDLPDGVEWVETVGGIEAYRLRENGMNILLLPDEVVPVATVMVTYRVGSRNEVAGTTGATHILEHMMFKGTPRFNSRDGSHGDSYSNQMERIGARSNATTWFDRTNYYTTLPGQYVDLAIELKADCMRNLLIREEDLKSEMTVVRNEYERGENNPVRTLIKELFATAYIAHPYGYPTIGWLSDIESISVEKLRTFYDAYYWPENAWITVIGGFDKVKTLSAIAQHYGQISSAPRAIPAVETVEPEQTGPRRVVVRRTGQTGVVMAGFKVPEGTHEDWATLRLLQQILGADKTGRLYRALEDRGKANATFTFGPQLRDPGLFIFGAYLTADADHEEVEAVILSEIKRLIADGVSEDELVRAKSVIKANTFYSRDGSYQIADLINEAIAMGDWTAYVNLPESIQAVSSELIRKVASKYFTEGRSTTGWLVPEVPNSLTGLSLSTPGPAYFRDPAVYAVTAERSVDRSVAGESSADSRSVVDFSSRMKRAKIGPIELIAIDLPIENVVSFVGSIGIDESSQAGKAPVLASLTAGMLDKGTEGADRFRIAEQLDSMGATIDFSSSSQSLHFSGRFLRRDAGLVMELLSDQLRNPSFPSEALETLKSREKARLLQAMDDPDYRAEAHLSRQLYPKDHANFKPSTDTLIKAIEQVTVEDFSAFHQKHYGPESMLLVFAGDIDFDQLQVAVGNAFEDWSGGDPYPESDATALENQKRSERIYIEDKTSVAVRLGYSTGLQRTDEDYLPFMLGNYILGGSFHSRLMTEVRQKRGLTYHIRTRHEGDLLTPGNWSLSVSLPPSMLEEGLAATYEVLEKWRSSGVSDEEVAAAVETLSGSYLVGLSTTGSVAGQVHSFMQRGLAPEYIDEYPLRLRTITAEEVNRAIQTYLDTDKLVEVVAGSAAKTQSVEITQSNTTPITVRLDVPDTSWRIRIEKVYRNDEKWLVVSKLSRSETEEEAAQVISTVSDTVEVDATDSKLPVQHYIVGKTWDWGQNGDYILLESMDDLNGSIFEDSELVFE